MLSRNTRERAFPALPILMTTLKNNYLLIGIVLILPGERQVEGKAKKTGATLLLLQSSAQS